MAKPYSKSLFIFRRDLRLFDNTGLNAALVQSEQVLCCFILDPRQIEPHPYQSRPGLQFMLEALQDLQQQFKQRNALLLVLEGQAEKVIVRLKQQHAIEAVFVNRDYTPFSRQRDADLQIFCEQNELGFHRYGDALLNEPEQLLKADGSAYQVFTAFYKRARQNPVALPQPLASANLFGRDQADAAGDLIKGLKQHHHNRLSGRRMSRLQPTARFSLTDGDQRFIGLSKVRLLFGQRSVLRGSGKTGQ